MWEQGAAATNWKWKKDESSEGGAGRARCPLRGPGSGKAGLGGSVTWFPLPLGATGPAQAEPSGLAAIGLMETDFREDQLLGA